VRVVDVDAPEQRHRQREDHDDGENGDETSHDQGAEQRLCPYNLPPMPRIQLLPTDLVNQIAAGEVVERPASVVKELIENAIDADATSIEILLENGGKKLIEVRDNGFGMSEEDARLAIERHATSKIRRADDLERIATLGFRGEALPSIASVSHFALRSRARGAAAGTDVRVNGGAVASVTEVGMPEGTSVHVSDLFYNLPARRKFLKSDAAESAQVSRVVPICKTGHPPAWLSVGARTPRPIRW